MDHIRVDDDNLDSTSSLVSASCFCLLFLPLSPVGRLLSGRSVLVEVKLRFLAVKLLYEVRRSQKLDIKDLRIFDDALIAFLFDLVVGRVEADYAGRVLELLRRQAHLSLNSQFKVTPLNFNHPQTNGYGHHRPSSNKTKNFELTIDHVLLVLTQRLGSSRNFGENMILMLNHAQCTPEDFVDATSRTEGPLSFAHHQGNGRVLTTSAPLLTSFSESWLIWTKRVRVSVIHISAFFIPPYQDLTTTTNVYALESLTGNSRFRETSPTMKCLVDGCLLAE